jgi:hypothetical protein
MRLLIVRKGRFLGLAAITDKIHVSQEFPGTPYGSYVRKTAHLGAPFFCFALMEQF